ncbi:MAG: BamA/TamA family outer membrane protein [Deltaproteobacteria bacterium]|nr:BamA/TamA family outer membrane protein [Deltaproteobacteria bacterium]
MRLRAMVAGLIALLIACDVAAVTVDELPAGAVYTVRAIRVEGARAVAASTLRDAMLTKLPPWYHLWARWRSRVVFNPQIFRSDLERVRTVLRESGHYEAAVTHDLEIDGDAMTIVLRVDEGRAVRLDAVRLVTTDFTPSAEEERALRGEVTLPPDAVFTQAAYDESRARLEAYFRQRGFAYVHVTKAAVVDTTSERAAVTYTITRGIPAVFGATAVTGNETIEERLITRELRYRPGDAYDPRKIEKTQANVFGLHLFRSVAVKPVNLDAQSGVVDVAITVAEGPPREVKIGAGYGLEDEFRGEVRWQHYDFLGGGRQLGFRLKGSSITQAVEGEFRQPYFLHPQQTFVVPLTQEREDEPGFTVARVRLAPQIERRFLPDVHAALGYNLEYDDTSNVPDETKARLDDFKARGIVSSVTALVERNTTVDLLDPHQGSVLNFTGEQAGGPWGGDFSFYRVVFEAKRYVPVFATRVLAGRVRIGGGDGIGGDRELPIFRRFFAGGINSTRGYARYKVGPLTSGGSPLGGRSVLEWNLEFRTPVYRDLGGVVFFDAGEVRESPFSYTLDDLQFGVGFGVRYRTIVGPLRVDLGFPLDRPRGEAGWQVHFSIGQAF